MMRKLTNMLLRTNRSTVVGLSFASLILLGAFLLMLPITHTNDQWLPFVDALFTATSATCVTGLVVVDTGTYFNLLGQIIIIMLIQIGGVGVMTLTTMIILQMGRHIGLKGKLLVQESLNQDGPAGVLNFAIRIIYITLAIEFTFGSLLAAHFYDNGMDILQATYFGYWHAISAFCNGGFDLMGDFNSLTGYHSDTVVNLTIISLITLGGLGFAVLEEIYLKRCWKRFSLHTKMVLVSYLFLSVGGAAIIWLFEIDNNLTIGALDGWDGIMASLFQAVTVRTAGFNTVDIASLREDTLFLLDALMFIGGAPASTAGGLKVTTFLTVLLVTFAVLRDRKDVTIFQRRISEDIVHKSMCIFILCLLWLGIAFFLLLTIDDGQHHFHLVLCELFSAFGTVGLGVGITPTWDPWCKLILILTMYIGRIGILTFSMSLIARKPRNIRYPSEDIIIG